MRVLQFWGYEHPFTTNSGSPSSDASTRDRTRLARLVSAVRSRRIGLLLSFRSIFTREPHVDVRGDEPDDPSVFRVLVRRSLAGIYLVADGKFLYANPRLKEIYGYPSDADFRGMLVLDLVAEEDRDRVRENIRQRLSGEVESLHYTVRGRRKDGNFVDLEAFGSRILWKGRPAIVGTVLDVTEQNRSRRELQEMADRLHLVLQATEDAVWDWEIATDRIHWEGAAAAIFGYPQEELGSRFGWFGERIHPEDRPRVHRRVQAILQGTGQSWSDEYRFQCGDGRFATLLERAYVVRGERGEPLRVIAAIMDLTERRRVEESQRFLSNASALLASSLDTHHLLAELARIAVPVLGDDCVIHLTKPNGGLRRVTEGHVAVTAAVPSGGAESADDEYPTLTSRAVGDGASLPACDEAAERAASGAGDENVVLRELGACSIISAALVAAGRRLGTITVATAAARRQYAAEDLALLEDLARRAALALNHAMMYEQATRAVQARQEVLSVVSHDLRNPLHTIQMYVAMLRDIAGERREEHRKWLGVIQRTVQQMNELLEELLDVSAIDAGNVAMERAERNVAALVRLACEALEPLADAKGVEFVTEVAEDLPNVSVDSNRILRVISNLVGNAVKFTPPGGRITMDVSARDDHIHFTVRDTGPGIPAAHLDRIFDRFWQARPGDRRGRGLGLAIARGIVEAHGGRIWAESPPGEGATFHFTLPFGRYPAVH